jgi:hypothetical protein
MFQWTTWWTIPSFDVVSGGCPVESLKTILDTTGAFE